MATGTGQRTLETLLYATCTLLVGAMAWRLAGQLHTPEALLAASAAALLAWALVDLGSGLVHWAFDTWGGERTPVLGSTLIRSFREHHRDPRSILRHDFIETNGASAVGALPLALLAWLHPPASILAEALCLFATVGILLANQCHKWAHAPRRALPRIVRLAQNARLLLRASAHRRHHRPPRDACYCTVSGWMNGPLDALRTFRALELAVRALTGRQPVR